MTDTPTLFDLLGTILGDWVNGNRHPYYYLTIKRKPGDSAVDDEGN